jgi:hypothetical protein
VYFLTYREEVVGCAFGEAEALKAVCLCVEEGGEWVQGVRMI